MTKYLTRESKGIELYTETGVEEQLFHHTRPDGYHTSGEAWKLDVGAECNSAMQCADELERTLDSGKKYPFANHNEVVADMTRKIAAIRSIVARVAEFEELEKEVE